MDNTFTGDYEFFQEVEDARQERYEMFDPSFEVEDADSGDITPDSEVEDDYYGDDGMDGDAGSALASCGWGMDEDYAFGYSDFGCSDNW